MSSSLGEPAGAFSFNTDGLFSDGGAWQLPSSSSPSGGLTITDGFFSMQTSAPQRTPLQWDDVPVLVVKESTPAAAAAGAFAAPAGSAAASDVAGRFRSSHAPASSLFPSTVSSAPPSSMVSDLSGAPPESLVGTFRRLHIPVIKATAWVEWGYSEADDALTLSGATAPWRRRDVKSKGAPQQGRAVAGEVLPTSGRHPNESPEEDDSQGSEDGMDQQVAARRLSRAEKKHERQKARRQATRAAAAAATGAGGGSDLNVSADGVSTSSLHAAAGAAAGKASVAPPPPAPPAASSTAAGQDSAAPAPRCKGCSTTLPGGREAEAPGVVRVNTQVNRKLNRVQRKGGAVTGGANGRSVLVFHPSEPPADLSLLNEVVSRVMRSHGFCGACVNKEIAVQVKPLTAITTEVTGFPKGVLGGGTSGGGGGSANATQKITVLPHLMVPTFVADALHAALSDALRKAPNKSGGMTVSLL